MIPNDIFAFVYVFCLVSCLFRALLEGERVGMQDANRRVNRHQRERIIGTVLNNINFFIAIFYCYLYTDYKRTL